MADKYYLYSKTHYHYLATVSVEVDNDKVGSTTTPVPEEDNLFYARFYLYTPSSDSWSFDLDYYKSYLKSVLYRLYKGYLNAKLLSVEQVLLPAAISLTKFAIDIKSDSLSSEQLSSLKESLDKAVQLLDWIAQATSYYKQQVSLLLDASDRDEAEAVLASVDFSQFDALYTALPLDVLILQLKEILG